MDTNNLLTEAKEKFEKVISFLEDELKKVRTGRAHPSMLDGITVNVYETTMPLMQVGTVATPESQLLQITPFDPNNIQAISQAIREDQSLGLNPIDDGRVIRIPIPPLTAERRQQIVKQLSSKTEEAMIRLRNVRHEYQDLAEAAKKDKDLSEDEVKRFFQQLDDIMQQKKSQIDQLEKAKQQEILTV